MLNITSYYSNANQSHNGVSSHTSQNGSHQKNLKRPWCWGRLKAGREGDDRGWDGWMSSLTWWTWVWVSSGSWWWTRTPCVVQSMGLQRVGHDWVTEVNWTVDVSGSESKVWCCKEQYCIGTWNVRSMNQGKLEETGMARVNINILGISERKWMWIGEFNLDGHCI